MSLTLISVATNPGVLTYDLALRSGEKIVLRPLVQSDSVALADFLSGLSLQTRRFYDFESCDIRKAAELCDAIAKYDKLRFVVELTGNKIIGLIEYSFDLTDDDTKRFAGYGYSLHQGSDCRFGPCLADEYQDQGLGSLLFPYVVEIAHRFDQKRIILWGGVLADNSRAIRYYQKNGFRAVGSFINAGIPCIDMLLAI